MTASLLGSNENNNFKQELLPAKNYYGGPDLPLLLLSSSVYELLFYSYIATSNLRPLMLSNLRSVGSRD
jgi:hypothetical protein